MRDYQKIEAWQHADNLAIDVYSKTKLFPKEEIYGLVSQLRRAAISVPANIVEGAGRQYKKDYLNFLYISQGSLNEMKYLLDVSRRLGYLNKNDHQLVADKAERVSRILYGLISSVKKEVG